MAQGEANLLRSRTAWHAKCLPRAILALFSPAVFAPAGLVKMVNIPKTKRAFCKGWVLHAAGDWAPAALAVSAFLTRSHFIDLQVQEAHDDEGKL